ncbi:MULTISPECIES: hypothetical protein [unclassified Virgibacillus]|uniref:hypothetical protein n=1 Tax=unclassified Virgibacillus TaxID=2620237 RepID=UPI0024DE02EF|nr:hypothetical protein [Virgibacillus sp. LDC-1]
MEETIKPIVIAIAAVSGGGKTATVNYLMEQLPYTKALFFDDYDFTGPKDIITWLNDGANYNDWDLSPFIYDLKRLQKEPLHYIILDYPFAYKNAQFRKLIDYAIFVDTPLDIALARRISRDFTDCSKSDILIEINNYITQGRRGYLEMLQSVKPNSDFIVDGRLSISQIAKEIMRNVHRNELHN